VIRRAPVCESLSTVVATFPKTELLLKIPWVSRYLLRYGNEILNAESHDLVVNFS
jgi:hypothetical protein